MRTILLLTLFCTFCMCKEICTRMYCVGNPEDISGIVQANCQECFSKAFPVCRASSVNATEFVECETMLTNCYLTKASLQRVENDNNTEVNERVCTDATASNNIIMPPLEVRYHEVDAHRFDCASITLSHALEYDESFSKFASQIGNFTLYAQWPHHLMILYRDAYSSATRDVTGRVTVNISTAMIENLRLPQFFVVFYQIQLNLGRLLEIDEKSHKVLISPVDTIADFGSRAFDVTLRRRTIKGKLFIVPFCLLAMLLTVIVVVLARRHYQRPTIVVSKSKIMHRLGFGRRSYAADYLYTPDNDVTVPLPSSERRCSCYRSENDPNIKAYRQLLSSVPMVLPMHVGELKKVHEECGCLHAPVYDSRVQGVRRLVHVVPSPYKMSNEELQVFNNALDELLTRHSKEVVGICDQDCRVMVVMKANEENEHEEEKLMR